MRYLFLLFVFLFINPTVVQASWQEREMSKIDRQIRKSQKCKCISKTIEVGKSKVSYYFMPNKIRLVRVVERKVINGATVFKQFFFDKKTGGLVSVIVGTTIYYYQSSGYFAVLSGSNFTPEEAEKRADNLLNLAQKYIKALK